MADVIIADGKLTPHASVSQVTLDWACGTDENDFELTIDDPDAPEIERGWYFWIDGSDVGGRIIDRRVTVSGGVSTTTWIGQSWTGMLAAKILQPDANQDYLTVSGKLPDILKNLLKRIGLDTVFTVDSSDASTLSNWMFQNPRYVDAYTGLRTLLASCGRRLDFKASGNKILLGIVPVQTIANTIDSDLVDFKAETNVTRALVKATDAASIDLGSYVSVGTGTDRGDNKTGEAAAYRKVISKTSVDSATTAINVSGAAFTTTTAMHVTQMPYLTGSTDGVLGNDGIPREDVSKTHQPIKLQGIELFAGLYETEGDIILKNVKDSDTSGHTEVWKVFDTTKASGTAITADYAHVGDYPAVNDKTDNQWQWQTDFTEKHGFLLPTGVGATSTSGLTDALIINPISAPGLHELRRGGGLWSGSLCGLFGADGWAGLSGAWWTSGGRLSVLGRTHA